MSDKPYVLLRFSVLYSVVELGVRLIAGLLCLDLVLTLSIMILVSSFLLCSIGIYLISTVNFLHRIHKVICVIEYLLCREWIPL